jgi:hypothetical protein
LGLAVAVAVGVTAVTYLTAAFDRPPASQPVMVIPQPAATPTVTAATPQPSGDAAAPASVRPPASGGQATEKEFTTTGGTVLARCTEDQVYLVFWSPQPGYRVAHVERGPGGEAEIAFARTGSTPIAVEFQCRDGTPVGRVERDGEHSYSSSPTASR